ncbi:hypothetical protein [Euzebya rosea]|nr:hypothetical protein [Euzebya rosea]
MDITTHADVPLTVRQRTIEVIALLLVASPVVGIAVWSMLTIL